MAFSAAWCQMPLVVDTPFGELLVWSEGRAAIALARTQWSVHWSLGEAL